MTSLCRTRIRRRPLVETDKNNCAATGIRAGMGTPTWYAQSYVRQLGLTKWTLKNYEIRSMVPVPNAIHRIS